MSPAADVPEPISEFPWRAWAPAICCFIGLIAATHVPLANGPPINNVDKLIHFGAYLILTISFLYGGERTVGSLRARHFFAVWLFVTFVGACDEITQSLPMFRRTTDIVDWMSDVAGVLTGIVVYQMWRPWLLALLDAGSFGPDEHS